MSPPQQRCWEASCERVVGYRCPQAEPILSSNNGNKTLRGRKLKSRALAEIFTFGASHLHAALKDEQGKTQQPTFSNSFFFSFCITEPRNLLPTDLHGGPNQPGWENKYEDKSHLLAHRTSCETLCRGKGLQVMVWKPGHDLHLLLFLPPREKGLPQGGSCHPAEDQHHRCSLCCLTAFARPLPSPSSPGSAVRSPAGAHACWSRRKAHGGDGYPAAGCVALALRGPCGTGRASSCPLLQLS